MDHMFIQRTIGVTIRKNLLESESQYVKDAPTYRFTYYQY